MLAVIWAVYVFSKNRKDSLVGQFRRDIRDIVSRFDEMTVVFQDNILFMTKTLLNGESSQTRGVYEKILRILDEPDKEAVIARMHDIEDEL